MSDMHDNEEMKELSPADSEWTNKLTLSAIKKDVSNAKSYTDDRIDKVREWLDHFYVRGSAKPNKIKGRSNHVPKLIRKHFEWRCATLISPFISSPDLFKTAPRTHADVEAARKNGLVLNYQFNNLLNKQSFLDNYVRTAASEGTTIVKVGWETKNIVRIEEEEQFEYVLAKTEEELQLAQQILSVYEQEPSFLNKSENEHYAQAVNLSIKRLNDGMSGFYIPKSLGMQKVKKRVKVRNQPKYEICNIHDITIDPACREDYKQAKFLEHRYESTLAELEESGLYENLDDIDVDSVTIENTAETHSNSGIPNATFNHDERRRKRILVHEYWRWHEAYNDGGLVPIVVTYVGNTCIRIEENPYPDMEFPFVFVPYIPVKNSPYGEPDAEFLKESQTLVGALNRSVLDTVGSVAAGQKGVAKNALDTIQYQNFKSGKDFLINPNIPMDQAIWTARPADVPQAAMALLQQEKIEGESFTGTKTYGNGGINGDSLGSSVGGIKQAAGASALRDSEILSRLVQGIKEIGRKTIAMNQEFMDPIEHIRITDDTFEEIQRDDLLGSVDIILSHSTAEEDNQKANEIAFLLQTLGNNASWEERAPLLAKLADLRKMPDLAEHYRTYEPQPDPQQQQLLQLQIAKEQKEIKLLDYEMFEKESKGVLNNAKAASESANTDMKNLEYVQEESGVNTERRKDEIKAQAEGNMELEILKQQLSSQNENLSTTTNS